MESNVKVLRELMDEAEVVQIKPSKVLQFRENRIVVPANVTSSAEFEIDGEKVATKILDISRFGARVSCNNSDVSLRAGDTTIQSNFSLNDTKIYSGRISVVNESRVNGLSVTFGIAFDEQGIDPDQIKAILDSDTLQSGLVTTKRLVEVSALVRPDFKILVADLNTLFQDLRMRLTEEESRIEQSATSPNHRKRLEEHAVNLAISLYVDDIHSLFSKFKQITDSLEFDESVIHKRYFRTNFHPLVIGSPFVSRSYNKPLGYAGDFGLMVMLYEYQDEGRSLFEKFFHRFSCNEPAAVANKNRVEFLANLLSETYGSYKQNGENKFKVSTLACGPAKEVELFLSDIEANSETPISIVCVDHESQALQYAQSRLKPYVGKKKTLTTSFFQEDVILSLIKGKGVSTEIEGSDVIVCAGLFDYLSDRVAGKLIEAMHRLLNPGGSLFIGNVSVDNPDRFSMDYFAEWNLVLRSSQDLHSLVPKHVLDQAAKVEVISESLGINLFLKLTK
jgi:extracellular factor (EF) 3-hydroxypalmitic acid methyl ester biosynthesis protein